MDNLPLQSGIANQGFGWRQPTRRFPMPPVGFDRAVGTQVQPFDQGGFRVPPAMPGGQPGPIGGGGGLPLNPALPNLPLGGNYHPQASPIPTDQGNTVQLQGGQPIQINPGGKPNPLFLGPPIPANPPNSGFGWRRG